MTELLDMFAVYDHPRDFPESFVVRRWTVHEGGRVVPDEECILCSTLEEARSCVPEGFFNVGRQEGDDPAIAEVWL